MKLKEVLQTLQSFGYDTTSDIDPDVMVSVVEADLGEIEATSAECEIISITEHEGKLFFVIDNPLS